MMVMDRIKNRSIIPRLIIGPIFALFLVVSYEIYKASIEPAIVNLRPVLVNLKATQLELTDFHVTMEITARKQLDCHALLGTQEGYVLVDGKYWERVEFTLGPIANNERFPVERDNRVIQAFGKWKWEGDIYKGSAVKATIDSICNYKMRETITRGQIVREVIGDKRTVVMGPFEIIRN